MEILNWLTDGYVYPHIDFVITIKVSCYCRQVRVDVCSHRLDLNLFKLLFSLLQRSCCYLLSFSHSSIHTDFHPRQSLFQTHKLINSSYTAISKLTSDMVRVKANSRHIYWDHVHNMRHVFRVFIVNRTELTGIILFRYLSKSFPY